MSRRLYNRLAASQSLSFYQNFIDDEPIDSVIKPRIVCEKDLGTADLEWLFGSAANSPRSVGISPAYSKSGSLQTFACALGNRVLIVDLHGSNSRDNGNTSGPRLGDTERRSLLQQELLCHPDCTFYAFDLATLALSLHLHLHLHIANAIDIQSALPVRGRSPVDSVRAIVGDNISEDRITSAFEATHYGSDEKENRDSLAQMAWLCGYLGQYDLGNTKDLFYAAPRVDTRKFPADELCVLQKISYDAQRLTSLKPTSMTHDVETSYTNPKTQQLVARSQNYSNRITPGLSRLRAEVTNGSETFSIPISTANTRGRSTRMNTAYNVGDRAVPSLVSDGRGALTRAELGRSLVLLRILQRALPLSNNHWMKAIWLPSDSDMWPESFSASGSESESSPPLEIVEHPDAPLNSSQRSAITHMLSLSLNDCITLIQGPPGTGKTTVIASYVDNAIRNGRTGIWLMAHNNVAVKNIAEKLDKLGFIHFKLLVSQGFHHEWHEHLYRNIAKYVIRTDELPKPNALKKVLQGVQVVLCTLDTITNPKLREMEFTGTVPVNSVVIDEASQIEIGQYLPLFESFGDTLRKISFIGDDKQLPPYGHDSLESLQSVFELAHLRSSAVFLDTQCVFADFLELEDRMPPQIGDFISQRVYDGGLQSYSRHPTKSRTIACHFVDINGSDSASGTSRINRQEVKAVTLIAERLQEKGISYRIITPYDAQRGALEQALKDNDLIWENKCFNVDSFQGNEDHYIIISLVRTKELGFLSKLRRTNVMLTRCQRGMYIVSNKAFLQGRGANSLVGQMAAELGNLPGAWLTQKDIEKGKIGGL
ncbi:P-loop containing nucleoside triphosphate hydrolase protein [Lactarius sanguifluus]|nr:P-loop containing nucleoside triphosphate hydrolase protein [Lactarius sanguifluus]